jgi:hypothetical protein
VKTIALLEGESMKKHDRWKIGLIKRVNRFCHKERLSMHTRGIHIALILIFTVALLLNGCTKSWSREDRYAVTRLDPGSALLFFLDSESQEKSCKMEARIARTMLRALEEANAHVPVVTSKEFCPDVLEPFYSAEDILRLLQDAEFNQRVKAKRIQYIVVVSVTGGPGVWSSYTGFKYGGWLAYNKRDTQHYAKATVIDSENAETAGDLVEQCSASAGYGVGVAADSGLCCVFPFAWYGGDTEDLAIQTLATSVAKFLTDKDALPKSKPPEQEMKPAGGPTETDSTSNEEVTTVAPETEHGVMERIELRDKAEVNLTNGETSAEVAERFFGPAHTQGSL